MGKRMSESLCFYLWNSQRRESFDFTMMETCSDSHSSPKRLLFDVGSFDLNVLLKDFMPERGKDAMDLPSQRVLMKLILLPLPLVTENDDTPLEEKKLQYRFRLTWGAHHKRSNLGSSKPHSNSQFPDLNIKRKRFSQSTASLPLQVRNWKLLYYKKNQNQRLLLHSRKSRGSKSFH